MQTDIDCRAMWVAANGGWRLFAPPPAKLG